MTEVEQLQSRITNLSAEDLARFRAWFVEFDAQRVKRGLPSNAGTANELVDESLADYGNGAAAAEATPADSLQGAMRRIAEQRS